MANFNSVIASKKSIGSVSSFLSALFQVRDRIEMVGAVRADELPDGFKRNVHPAPEYGGFCTNSVFMSLLICCSWLGVWPVRAQFYTAQAFSARPLFRHGKKLLDNFQDLYYFPQTRAFLFGRPISGVKSTEKSHFRRDVVYYGPRGRRILL